MRYVTTKLLSASTVSGTTPIVSGPLASEQLYQLSVQVVLSDGAGAGTLKLQASNDPSSVDMLNASTNPTHWSDITGATIAVTSGAGPMLATLASAYRFIRCVYTPSAGAGTISVQLNAQSF